MVRVSLAALIAASLLTAAETDSTSSDWATFRGPNRDNLSPDKSLLKEWKETPKLLWTGEDCGIGYSSVSVAGPRIFTMGDNDGKAHVIALDRKTGKKLWKTAIGGECRQKNKDWRGSRSTPTVDGSLVYSVGPQGDLVALKVEDGSVAWKKNFKTDFGGTHGSWEYSESPLVDGDNLLATPGGKDATIVCLDKKTGNLVWKSSIGGQAGYSSIVIGNAGNVKQYVTLLAGGTVGVDAKTGKLLWQYSKLSPNTANIPTPIVKGDQVFTLAGYGKAAALLTLSKKDDGTFDVKEEYYNTAMKNKHGGAVIVGDLVFADTDSNGQVYCAKWKTGEVLDSWKKKTTKGRGSASLTYADGHLYIRYTNGVMSLVPATADGYKEVGSFQIPPSGRSSWAHPVVIDGKLFIREDDKLYCHDLKAN
ncbi:MAG: polyvinylalcohol dehydrogenase [Planctomycetia bacterium]|nr:polyvinylalcohol dehydrogenase [Planctomycetia bacterium]